MSNLVQTRTPSFAQEVAGVELEATLLASLQRATSRSCPGTLSRALHYAVFPGGARLRPRLLVAIASAVGPLAAHPLSANDLVCVAAAVELLHCASLVHDDLPCFDDAALRRGRPTVARAFDVPTAVLVGDALIVHAFEELADVIGHVGGAVGSALLRHFGAAVGARGGLIAGQAWELEATAPLEAYHRAKTGSLFSLAGRAAALLTGAAPEPWAELGDRLGLAYQALDDVADVTGSDATLGKSTGRDATLTRPSLVRAHGVEGARERARRAVDAAMSSIPACARGDELRSWLLSLMAHSPVVQAAALSPTPPI